MIVLNQGAEKAKERRSDVIRTAVKRAKAPGSQDTSSGAGFVGQSITVPLLPTGADTFILGVDELGGPAVLG